MLGEGGRGGDREGGSEMETEMETRGQSQNGNREGEEERNHQETLVDQPCLLVLSEANHLRTQGEAFLAQNPRPFAGTLAHFLRWPHLISGHGHHPNPAGALPKHILLSGTPCPPRMTPQPSLPFLLVLGWLPISDPSPSTCPNWLPTD